jgi:DNA end-binding protein Ku
MVDSVWNGFLRLSLVSCPIRLQSATSNAKRLRLEQLSARTGNPVTQQFVDGKTGDVVAADALVKGYEFAPSRYVTLSEDELRQAAAAQSNIIDLEHFVPGGQFDRLHVEATYYVHPEGQLASDTVHALRLAMRHSGRVALGHMWLGERELPVLVEPRLGGLTLSTLHTAAEMVPAEFGERADADIPGEMIEIAEAIIARRSGDFTPGLLQDRFQDAVRTLIDEKAKNAPPRIVPVPPPEPPAPMAAPPVPPSAEPVPPRAVEPITPEPTAPPAPPTVEAAAPEVIEAPEPPPAPAPPPAEAEATAAPPEPEPEPVQAEPPIAEPQSEPPQPTPTGPHDIGAEILLHIMGLGDRRYVEPGWAGNPGSRRQIEALSIRPRDDVAADAVEFRVFAQEGRATAWVSNGNYAGTRGRNLPLTGFAVRPSDEFGDRLDIIYEGAFFEGGVIGPKRNGELCISPVADDPLEAVRITIVGRPAEPA